MRAKEFLITFGLSAVGAAIFPLVPFFGLVFFGAAIQLLSALGNVIGWDWLNYRQGYSGYVAWVIFTLIFFASYHLFLKKTLEASRT